MKALRYLGLLAGIASMLHAVVSKLGESISWG